MPGILLLRVLNKGFAVSWLILAIIVVRLFLKKAPKWSVCLLWGLVAVRLLLPFSFVSAFSLVPSAELVQQNIDTSNAEVPRIDSGIAIVNETVNPVVERALTADEITGINKVRTAQFYLSIVWITGASAMLLYALISFGLLKRRVRASVAIKDRVMVCDDVKSPFILGIVRPLIYVPSDMGGDTLDLVIAHETAHLKRHDHWWKPLGFVLLAIYWFNPLCWAAYVLLCRDIEAACDEKVIRDQSKEYAAAYSQALLDCSVHRRMIAACPLAFGEIGVKARIKAILNYRKPAFWIIAAALLGCIAVAVCFLTDPFPSSISSDLNSVLEKTVLDGDTIYNEDYYRCCDIKALRSNTDGNVMTVYAWVLDEEYSYINGEIHDESGSHFPAIFTVNIVSDGYEMADDYWIPRDGADYVSSIHEHFPVSLWNKAIDSQRYIEEQQARCMEKARQHFQALEGIDALESLDDTDRVARPVVNLSDTEGADLTELLYADRDKIVFSGYYGLFVYSKEERNIVASVDLEPIGCHYTQGDNACDKFVSEDGNTVYLHPVSWSDMYVYDILTDSLKREVFDLSGIELHETQKNEEGEQFDVWDGEDRRMETHLHHGSFIGELGYVECGETSADVVIPYYPFFSPSGLAGAVDFAPADIHEIISADIWIGGTVFPQELGLPAGQGYLLHCDDAEKINELERLLSDAVQEKVQSGCPFYTALYLTRSDGTVGTVFPATDSCAMYISGRRCFKYADGTNEALWDLIEEFEQKEVNAN